MDVVKREVRHYRSSLGRDFFQEWLEALHDVRAQDVILKRIGRIEDGLLGDHKFVGEGVWELRIDKRGK